MSAQKKSQRFCMLEGGRAARAVGFGPAQAQPSANVPARAIRSPVRILLI
jgi:hypothetical protein